LVKTLKLLKTDIEALSDHLLNQMKEIQNIYVNIFSISGYDGFVTNSNFSDCKAKCESMNSPTGALCL